MSDIKKIIEEDYKRKVKKFEQIKDEGKVVIIGDSMVAYLNLSKFGLEKEIINQGIAGDTTIGVLDRLHLVYKLKPSKVIISVGSNDIVLTDLNLDETVYNILEIKNEIEKHTSAKVFIMSLTPILKDSPITNHEYVSNRTNEDIDYINKELKKKLDENVFFLVGDDLKDQHGNLNIKYTTDGIHLNHEGYKKYVFFLKKH